MIELLGKARASCLEPKPTCGTKCQKKLECGHRCALVCHSGACSCGQLLKRTCRCGKNDLEIPCEMLPQGASSRPVESNAFFLIDTTGDEKRVCCKTACTQKMSCLKHVCGNLCCDLGSHVCPKVCNSELSCTHHCHAKCHRGPCPPCNVMLSRAITCACGDKVLRPPQLCGTEVPFCPNVCGKILACGHQCYAKCHFGQCPPCEELVDKNCLCAKQLVTARDCHKDALCGNLCREQLACGHECSFTCHAPGRCEELRNAKASTFKIPSSASEEERTFYADHEKIKFASCFSLCGKPKECGHPC